MVKSFKRLDYAPPLFFAQGAAHPRFIALLGQDAEWSLGAVDFDPRLGGPARELCQGLHGEVRPCRPACRRRKATPPAACSAPRCARPAPSRRRACARRSPSSSRRPCSANTASLPDSGAQIGAKPRVVQIRRGRPRARHAAAALSAMGRASPDQMSLNRSFLFAPATWRAAWRRRSPSRPTRSSSTWRTRSPSARRRRRARAVAEALARPRRARGYVRVNAPSSEFCYRDLVETLHRKVDGVVVPKIESAADLHAIDWLMANLEREFGAEPGTHRPHPADRDRRRRAARRPHPSGAAACVPTKGRGA